MQTDIRKALFGVVIAAASLVGGTSLALADDDAKAAEAAAAAVDLGPVANWNGAYIGLEGGFGQGAGYWDFLVGPAVDAPTSGGLVGVNARVLRQVGNWVGGLEANADVTNIVGHTRCPNYKFNCEAKTDGLASINGVLGYAAGRWLVYGVAGVGAEQVSEQGLFVSDSHINDSTGQRTKFGWTAGIGFESALSSRVSLGAQYLHYTFGSDYQGLVSPALGRVNTVSNFREQNDTIEAHINFKLTGDERHTPLK